MFRFLSQHRVLLLVLLLVLISLHLLSTGLKKQTDVSFAGRVVLAVYSPIYKVLSWPFVKVAGGMSHYIYLVSVKDSNESLQHQNAVLMGNLVELEELRTENRRLEKLLGLRSPVRQPVAFARVIGRGEKSEFHVILIDKGAGDGVEKGMAVTAPAGLVGYVAAATRGASKVVVITDAGARIDAVIQRTRRQAMAFGQGKDELTVRYLESDADVAEGDRLVTSGLGGVFPKGIAIGEIQRIDRGEFDVIRDITVVPSVELGTVEEVAVFPGPGLKLLGLEP
jgi:rod shape-determining protein MreC